MATVYRRLSFSERYASRLANTRRPNVVWTKSPEGWGVDLFAEPGGDRWRAVHEATGAVDKQPFGVRWMAVRRAWDLAVQAELGLRMAACPRELRVMGAHA